MQDRRMRGLAIILAGVLAACATAQPINAPLAAPQAEAPGRAPVGDDIIVLALSGGGARAASFSLGVLQGLRDMQDADGRRLSEHIALISSVSGGSVLAAYYAQHGEAGLDSFRAAYLDKDWRVRRQTSPLGLFAALRGGMNGPAQLADWLDRELYRGAHMGALGRGPRVVINASDLYNATAFAFTPFYFDGVCSDLSQVRVADAVAASMAAPVLFRPVLAQSFPGAQCDDMAWTSRVLADRTAPESAQATARAFLNYRGDGRARQSFVLLGDGGLTDNLGLLSLSVMRMAEPAPAPLTAREAIQARRVLVLVVNAEYVRPRTFQQRATDAYGAYEMVYAALDASVDAAKRSALDAFRATLPEFERALRDFRCRQGVERCEEIELTMDVISFHDTDAYEDIYEVPTDVSIAPACVTALIAAGRAAVERNAAVAALRDGAPRAISDGGEEAASRARCRPSPSPPR
jgi:NTE family protein